MLFPELAFWVVLFTLLKSVQNVTNFYSTGIVKAGLSSHNPVRVRRWRSIKLIFAGNAKGQILIVSVVAITITGIGVWIILALCFKKRLSSDNSTVSEEVSKKLPH
ncbi:hypothetical protein QYF36_001867 [Acer negundo]|nr:hypothetical protein QYF36_001867 [Acer negundo]